MVWCKWEDSSKTCSQMTPGEVDATEATQTDPPTPAPTVALTAAPTVHLDVCKIRIHNELFTATVRQALHGKFLCNAMHVLCSLFTRASSPFSFPPGAVDSLR